MRLKTRFAVTMLLFGSLLTAVGVALTVTNARTQRTARQEEIAGQIALQVSQLNYLIGDYLMNRESRELSRWRAGFDSFALQLQSLKADDPREQALILNLRENGRRLGEVYAGITRGLRTELPEVDWSRMSIQTLSVIADASQLARLVREEAQRLSMAGAFYLNSFFGLVCLFFLLNFVLTYQQTVKSLNLLRAGARRIGAGELDFRIEAGRNDETSEVAEAFNQMALGLKTVTVSKTELEQRVLERSGEIFRERRRLYDVLETLPAMICLLTPDHQVAFANRSFRERFGESGGQPCYAYCFGKSTPCEFCQTYRVLETGKPQHWEISAPDQSVLEVHDFPFSDVDGSPMILKMNLDISARRRAEAELRNYRDHLEDLVKERTAALRDREEKLSTLYRSMSEGLTMHEVVYEGGQAVDYVITDVNPAFEAITGLPRELAVGRRASELYGTGQAPYLELYAPVAAGGGPKRFETYFAPMRKHFDVSVFSPGKGKFATVFTDITVRKKAEAEAAQANADLQRHADEVQASNLALVESRRAALNIMEDVIQAREALERLNQTLEQKVADRTELAESRSKQLQALAVQLIEAEELERRRVSNLLHDDLQQLLAAARFQLEAATRGRTPEPFLANVGSLLDESITKARRLSHELSPAVLHHSDLAAVLEWLARQMKQQFGLEVELEIRAGLQSLSTPLKVFAFRAVQELLFNVVKHAGVDKAFTSAGSSNDSLIVTVSDRGRGFEPGILTPPASTGFGLLSLRERANFIGGSLEVDSAPGQGSRFTLMLPLKLGEAVQAPAPEPPAGEAQAASRPLPAPSAEGIRVLFVDDHKVLRQGLIKLLAGQPGIQVIGEAANGREALSLVRQLRPDVVVMDITMPVMDGLEATRRIKAEYPAIHVIGLSVYEEAEAARRMRQAGAELFVSKNASSSQLLKAIYQAARGA